MKGRHSTARMAKFDVDDIALVMSSISRNPEKWFKCKVEDKNDLYGQVVRAFKSKNQEQDRLWLRICFCQNRRKLRSKYLELIGMPVGKLSVPVATSTPMRSEKYCICQGKEYGDMIECTECLNWFHGVCIRVDVRIAGKQEVFRCPKCKNNSYIKFPSVWLESISVPDDNVSSIDGGANIPHVIETPANLTHLSQECNSVLPVPTQDHTQNKQVSNTPKRPNQSVNLSRRRKLFVGTAVFAASPDTAENRPDDLEFPGVAQDVVHVIADDLSEEEAIMSNEEGTGDRADYVDDGNDQPVIEQQMASQLKSPCLLAAVYTDKQDHVVVETSSITVKVPKVFTFTIDNNIWNKYVERRITTSGFVKQGMRKGWLDVMRTHFRRFNSCCVFNFERQVVKLGKRGTLYEADAYCSHRPDCFSAIKVTAQRHDKLSTIVFTVRCQGTIKHRTFKTLRNRLQAEEREAMRKVLKHRQGDAVATELAEVSDAFPRRCGNMTAVPSGQVLRQIRHETLKERDTSQDPIIDLLTRMKEQPATGEFVRACSVKPLTVAMFSNAQLEILRALRKYKEPVVLHIDATGNVVRHLQEHLGDEQILLYSVVVANPKSKSPPLAICEFLSNSQSTDSIALGLSTFRHGAETYLDKPPCNWMKRVETDFSLAVIAAAIRTFWQGHSTRSYLNMCWDEIFKIQIPSPLNLHVCRAHNMRTFEKALADNYGKDKDTEPTRSHLIKLLRRYLHSRTIYSCTFYVQKLFRICCSKALTHKVRDDIDTINASSPDMFQLDCPINQHDFRWPHLTAKTICEGTSFGKYFHHVKQTVCDEIATEDVTECSSNQFYNEDFVKYILAHILPFTPMLTHVMFAIRKDLRNHDTQAAVENWNDLVKHHEQCMNGKLSLPRFVDQAMHVISGRCIRYDTDFATYLGGKSGVNKKRKPRTEKSLPSAHTPSKISKSEETEASFKLKEEWRKKGKQVAVRQDHAALLKTLPFIKWGLFAKDKADYVFTNTCTLDNTMFMLMFLHHTDENVSNFFLRPTSPFPSWREIILDLLAGRINLARGKWLKLGNFKLVPKPKQNNLWDDEYEFLGYIHTLFEDYRRVHYCEICEYAKVKRFPINALSHKSIAEILARLHETCPSSSLRCGTCNAFYYVSYEKTSLAPIPFLPLHIHPRNAEYSFPVKVEDIPTLIKVYEHEYELVGVSLFQNDRSHFVLQFLYDGRWFKYDGMDLGKLPKGKFKDYTAVSNCWYKVKQH